MHYTNHVLDFIIDDIVEGSTTGFPCVDAFSNKLRVFFDVLGFIGDYPASNAVVDTAGQSAIAPCTHCSFVRSNNTGMSVYAFSTSITSSNSTYRRS